MFEAIVRFIVFDFLLTFSFQVLNYQVQKLSIRRKHIYPFYFGKVKLFLRSNYKF